MKINVSLVLYYMSLKYFWKFDEVMRENENSFSIEPRFLCFKQENNIPFEDSEH